MTLLHRLYRAEGILLAIGFSIPLIDAVLGSVGLRDWRIGNEVCQRVLVYAILGLGLNVVIGYTGLLHLGVAAFMAIGVYAYAILTCNIYPYQIGFWPALLAVPAIGAAAGILLGAPTLRLRGDYLAIVTLGFGEIMQDVIKNVERVTQGTKGINPLPPPSVPGYAFTSEHYEPWYYLFLAILAGLVVLVRNLERSRLGRQWMSLREDELAATAMGINPVRTKLMAFAIGAALCALAGVLWASKLTTTAEPTTYDFSMSITVLVLLIVGGLGSLKGVLAGAGIVMGFDIVLNKLTGAMGATGANVFLTPNNWKFLVFGLALVVMMRFKPLGIFPAERERPAEKAEPEVTRVGVE